MKCNNNNFVTLSQNEVRESKKNLATDFVYDQVPDPVIELNKKFYGCPSCRKLYWEGSHWDRAAR